MMYIPKALEKYKHFKGKCYQVICVAENSEDGKKEVIYQALYAPFKIYARTLEMFISKVDKDKYPDADQEYRFELLDDEGFIVKRRDVSEEPTLETIFDDEEGQKEVIFDDEDNDKKEDSKEDDKEDNIEKIITEDGIITENKNAADDEMIPEDIIDSAEKKSDINPLLLKFLDASSFDEKIEIINNEKENMTPEILTPIELSIGLEPSDADVAQRCREIKNFLLLKQKYERQYR